MKQLERACSELAESRRFPKFVAPPLYAEHEFPRVEVSPLHCWRVVFRRKWTILGFAAACTLAAYLICSRLTPIYQATAKIDIDRQVPAGVIGQEAARTAGTGDDADVFMATQIQLIQSDAVLRPVAQRFNLWQREGRLPDVARERARKKSEAPVYLKHLKIVRPLNTYILNIAYESPDAQLAADVANAVAQSYLQHTFEIRVHSSSALSAFMERQLGELKAKMERSSTALAKFEQELNVINPEQKTDILSSRLLQLNTEYTSAQGERVRKEAAYQAMQSGTIAAAEASVQGAELNKLHERVNQAKQRLADIGSIYGPAHQQYRKAASDLNEVQRQFDEMRANVEQRAESDYHEALSREQMLYKALGQSKAEYDQLNAHSFEYQQLKRDAETDKALYNDLERRIREAGINAGFQSTSIRIADLARPPDLPVFPRKVLTVVLVLILSLIASICGVILADVLDNTIRDPEQAARALETSVLGTLPAVKDLKRGGNAVLRSPLPEAAMRNKTGSGSTLGLLPPQAGDEKPRDLIVCPFENESEGISMYEEAIRSLRHSILLPDFDRVIKSILVTSAEPAVGKSTALTHLAIAHAEQGRRTLIIDADLRRPTITKKLRLNTTLGLANVLLGEMPWKDAVVKPREWRELHVLPAGGPSRRASDLVGSLMIDILDEAGKEYDLILVDAPPLLGFAEAMQVATAVDAVLVMARAGETSRSAVATVLATLRRVRANVIGLVLNEVDKHSTDGYYHYKDYKHYYAASRRDT